MKRTGAFLVRYALEQIGVRQTFGIPGVHTTEIYDELNNSNQIRPLLVTHEVGAAFMADAVSRTSDQIGVCVVVPAAGLTHAASGIGEAFLDGIPMLVLSGGVRTDTGRAYQLHQIDQQALMAPITKATFLAETHNDIIPMLYKAYDTAISGEPGPVYVEIPVNLQLLKGEVTDLPDYAKPSDVSNVVSDADIDRAADLLVQASKPALFLGWGAKKARAAAIDIAEMLGAPVATSLQGLGVFPADHPLHTGMGYSRSAVPAAQNAFDGCDVMLAVGVRFGEIATGSYGEDPPEVLIHLDINPEAINANYPAKIALVGDAADILPKLAAKLKERVGEAKGETPLATQIKQDKHAYKEEWLTHKSEGRVNPGLFYEALDRHLSDRAIIVTDDGNHTFLTAELMPISGARQFISPTDFNCMGYCVPAAAAAKLVNPDKDVVGIVGDGAFLMTGMELITAQTEGLGVAYFVFSDGELAQIAQAQDVPYNRKSCTQLPALNLEAFSAATGLAFHTITSNADIDDVVSSALATAAQGKPVLVDVAIDYSKKTRFTEGTIKTNLKRFDLPTQLRFVGRALTRRITG